MGRQQRLLHNLKKGEQMKEQEFGRLLSYAEVFTKRSKPKLISLLLFSLLSGCFIFAPHLLCFSPPSALSPLGSVKASDVHSHTLLSMPSTVSDEGMWCDRTGFRTDICFMKGDIRTHSPSSSILVYTGSQDRSDGFTNHASHEKIKPYTRKWEASVMDTITELNLVYFSSIAFYHERTKYIELDYHVVREKIKSGFIKTQYVASVDQVADLLTKSLSADKMNHLLIKMGIQSLYALS
ncbi:PREDICTED: uncharacterized protein LOC104824501 [Tarenaya hassleriana]|uniref:uncharacterized protein LOC104824501 n=1 Tax=Tarenaya hassleriana TaxID=28532 RepID=UPI00053C964E|nr:PREDICTED: uncharacterized protein LOC104824501 [Tarenaya hassleriana]